jgi:hypothetical protein
MLGSNVKLDELLKKPLPVIDWAGIIAMVADGTMMELGVWQGASFREICRLAHPRRVYGFDWFRGLPEDWAAEGSAGTGDLDGVIPDCPENGEFVVGLVQGTLPDFVADHFPAAFVHFDMDLYSSTAAALHYIEFTPGAILAFDEIDRDVRNINHEQKAFREWLEDAPYDFEVLGQRHAESWVIRLLTAQA